MRHFALSVPGPTAPGVCTTWIARFWPEALAVATALVFCACCLNAVPGPDVAWQLWIAHQIRMGARLYQDIIETNPPLWFWEAVPLDWVGAAIGVPSRVVLVAATGLAVAASVWSTGRLVAHLPARWRAALLVYAVLTLLLMPLIDVGQREQFVLIATLPYAALAAARQTGRAVNPAFAAAIGAAACFGFALKHYFLIVPVLLELWLMIGRRRGYRPLRPETIALATTGLIYGAAIVTVTPDFLTRMVPLNRLAYAIGGAPDLASMIRPIQYYWALAIIPLIVQLGAVRRSPNAAAMLLAALGFGMGWLIQFKGFPYHSIPASGCLMMAIALFVVENPAALNFLTRVAAPTLLLLPLGFTAWYGRYRNDFAPIIQPMLHGVGPHQSVAFVSDQAVFAWPLTLYRDAPYPSRHYGMWILRAVALDHGRTPALAAIGRQVVEDTTQDFRCAQPARIIFSRKPIEGFNIERWFMASASFATLMRHYRPLGSYRIFEVYELKAPFARPPAATCRRNF